MPVVRKSRVGALDDPAEPETHRLFRLGNPAKFASLDVEIVETEGVELAADLGEVVAAVEVERFDVDQQAVTVRIGEGGFQQFEVEAVASRPGLRRHTHPPIRDLPHLNPHRAIRQVECLNRPCRTTCARQYWCPGGGDGVHRQGADS